MTESMQVLVVDDDPDVRELLDDYLSEQGYEVISADSAATAREILEDRTPSVVLLDVGLPGEDGLSLARHIRERFDIGIIMVSRTFQKQSGYNPRHVWKSSGYVHPLIFSSSAAELYRQPSRHLPRSV